MNIKKRQLVIVLTVLLMACTVRQQSQKDIKEVNLNYPHLTSKYKAFDTSKFREKKSDLVIKNGDTIYCHYDLTSYYEVNKSGYILKEFSRGTGPSASIDGYDYSADPIFGIFQEYTHSGHLIAKGIYCWFGFNIGQWFYFGSKGKLEKKVDYDLGYKFDVADIMAFCKNNSIPLEKKLSGPTTDIQKRTLPNGRKIWLIRFAKIQTQEIITLQLDANDGKVIKTASSLLPLN